MTEQVKRSVDEICSELFVGREAALEKYAMVRRVQYEILLLYNYHVPLSQISMKSRIYFSERFLDGARVDEADKATTLPEAIVRLDHAVNDGCKKRCTRLVKELNDALARYGIPALKDIQGFLDWLTFSFKERKDGYGMTMYEPDYGFPMLIFDSDKHRKEFWAELKALLKAKKVMSLVDIAKIVQFKGKRVVHM